MKRIVTSSLIALALAAPLAVPAASAACDRPGVQTLSGVINTIDGKYALTLRDRDGMLDRVTLHQGTIINPAGLTLRAGLPVMIIGSARGTTFEAHSIHAPEIAMPPPAYVPQLPVGE